MRIDFSTDDLPVQDRVRFWCDYFAQQAHSFTPGEVPDASRFRAEAKGHAAGGFALINIEAGLEKARRTAADVARDRTEAFFVRRFRRPLVWKAAPLSTPVDLAFETGDFCVSATEWRFDAESKGGARFGMLIIPNAALSPLLAGGRLARPFRLPAASPLGSLLGAAVDAAAAQVPLLSDELGEGVLRNLCGLVALACGASEEGDERGRGLAQGGAARGGQAAYRSQSGRSRLHSRQRRRRAWRLGAPAASAVRADREQFRALCAAPAAAQVPRRGRRRDRNRPVGGGHRFRLGLQQHGNVLSRLRQRVRGGAGRAARGVRAGGSRRQSRLIGAH